MQVVLTEPLKISDKQTLPAGLSIGLDEGTAHDLIAAGKAKRAPKAKEDQVAASRKTKPAVGPTETK
jgi:hypothetical protein